MPFALRGSYNTAACRKARSSKPHCGENEMVMLSRRTLLGTSLAAIGVEAAAQGNPLHADESRHPAAATQLSITRGPFQPTAESLKSYQTPAWFRDAKFGIWAHWGPQAVPRSG